MLNTGSIRSRLKWEKINNQAETNLTILTINGNIKIVSKHIISIIHTYKHPKILFIHIPYIEIIGFL